MLALATDSSGSIDAESFGDAELVIDIARGERAALAALYDRFAPIMLALGQRILGNRLEAEDVLHDVFVDVWKRAGDYDPARGKVKTWLLLRMRSRSIDRKRLVWNKRTEGLPEREDSSRAAEPGQGAAADALRVRVAIGDLPPEQAQVVALGYFAGMSCSEMAEQLSVPIGTVKSRLAGAMRKLRARLIDAEVPS